MEVIESYGKDTVAGCRDTKAGFLFLVMSDFPSTSYAKFIQPNERAPKMLRIHHLHLFRTHRS